MEQFRSSTPEPESLWIPGISLDDDFPAITVDALRNQFRGLLETGAAVTDVDSILGTLRVPNPDERITGIVSIDLCEVLRYTARGLAACGGKEDYDGSNYINALWADERFMNDIIHADNTIQPIVQVMMNNNHVEPIQGIQMIANYIRDWRAQGVYCIANTSTASGCEAATVRFLQRYTPNCFDGIVFPRNPDGRGKTTKAAALKQVLTQLDDFGFVPDFALHVDDTTHHISSMLTEQPHERMHLFVPAYPENIAVSALADNITRSRTPLDSFTAMHSYISDRVYA